MKKLLADSGMDDVAVESAALHSASFGAQRRKGGEFWLMKKKVAFSLVAGMLSAAFASGVSPEKFRDPPPEARPHAWWHWMNGNVTKSGITADLESMAAVGIGGAQIFDAGLALPKGTVEFASDEWFDCLVHADREAKRLGIELCVANCSGWTSSGGPWVTPELSMKYVACSEVHVRGGELFDGTLPLPENAKGFYGDIAVLAIPANSKPVLKSMPDFDMQVFRGRGSFKLGIHEGGPQMPVAITEEAAPQSMCVAQSDVMDLTNLMRGNGRLVWTAPSSDVGWTVLRIGYKANGRTNRSASEKGIGLECDKLDPHALDVHFDAYVGRLIGMLPNDRALSGVLLDSYEVFGQNWTRGFDGRFAEIAGYSITNYLPVIAGYPIGCAADTEKFLRDFRHVISRLFVKNYAGRLRERCHENGLRFYCEPYGNGPFNDLEFARECDVPMAEFWRPRNYDCDLAALDRAGGGNYMMCRWGSKPIGNAKIVASTAHAWGRCIVGAEAFTSYPDEASGRWLASPRSMKLQCDRVFTDGVNLMVFHRFAHQPWTAPTRYPGMTMAAYGSHIDRTQTWWNHGAKEFFAYMARAQHLLRQGVHVADVVICTSGEAPDYGMAEIIPAGYSGDRYHPDAFALCRNEGGFVVSPGGAIYRAAVGRGENAADVLRRNGITSDFICNDKDVTCIHRRVDGDDIYFVAVPNKYRKNVKCSFRDGCGRVPELWNPVTGEISSVCGDEYSVDSCGRAEVSLDCEPLHSVFVVFRKPADRNCVVRHVRKEGSPVESVSVEGPWSVSFREPGADVDIATATFSKLVSWTESSNANIRYFSGTATYCKDIVLNSAWRSIESSRRVYLDLGDVHEIAEVTVNGHNYAASWKPPYRVDVTDVITNIEGGENVLHIEVKVTNLWPNRLIGDARLPDDSVWDDGSDSKGYPLIKQWPEWLQRGLPSPTGRHTFTTCRLWASDDKLLESGLIGPVRLEAVNLL